MAKSAKTASAPKSFKSYALNKCLIGYGVVNGIINAAIFAGLHAAAEGATFDMGAVVSDLSFTGLLLGMLLFACVVPLTRMDLRHGRFSLPTPGQGTFALMPGSYVGSLFATGAIALVAMTGLSSVASLFLPAAGISVTAMMLLKGVLCALGGAIAGWCTLSFVVRAQQQADAVAAAMAARTAEAAA